MPMNLSPQTLAMRGRLSKHFLPAMQRRYIELEVEAIGMGAAGIIPESTVP